MDLNTMVDLNTARPARHAGPFSFNCSHKCTMTQGAGERLQRQSIVGER
jgi:hypothetical protein